MRDTLRRAWARYRFTPYQAFLLTILAYPFAKHHVGWVDEYIGPERRRELRAMREEREERKRAARAERERERSERSARADPSTATSTSGAPPNS